MDCDRLLELYKYDKTRAYMLTCIWMRAPQQDRQYAAQFAEFGWGGNVRALAATIVQDAQRYAYSILDKPHVREFLRNWYSETSGQTVGKVLEGLRNLNSTLVKIFVSHSYATLFYDTRCLAVLIILRQLGESFTAAQSEVLSRAIRHLIIYDGWGRKWFDNHGRPGGNHSIYPELTVLQQIATDKGAKTFPDTLMEDMRIAYELCMNATAYEVELRLAQRAADLMPLFTHYMSGSWYSEEVEGFNLKRFAFLLHEEPEDLKNAMSIAGYAF